MIKIDAIVREDVLEDLKDALAAMNIRGMTISQVMGCGTQMGYHERVRGTEIDINLLPKLKIEIVVSSKEWSDKVVDVISKVAYTGEHGDGKIFIYELLDTVRIRTGEHGPFGLWAEGQKQ